MSTLRFSPRSDAGILVIEIELRKLTALVEACEARIQAGYAKLRLGDPTGEQDADRAFAEQELVRAEVERLERTLVQAVNNPPASKAGQRIRGLGR